MPSFVSNSSTRPCACVQSPFASHHSAANGADNPSGGNCCLVLSRNRLAFIALPSPALVPIFDFLHPLSDLNHILRWLTRIRIVSISACYEARFEGVDKADSGSPETRSPQEVGPWVSPED